MNLLLDTHIWIWWVQQTGQLTPSQSALIENAETVQVSAISCWEAMMLQQQSRIQLHRSPEEWFSLATRQSGIEVVPISENIAIKAAALPFHHKDPADRIIIATALESALQLFSYDSKFTLYAELEACLIAGSR